ncbi:hypothetical protein ILYODFUR_030374 [Ilyodon furcidens]|uniref:Uncharacterized protein n=1 Tax=Ilyodon furcidens TaxID=33524 RepID=A0ABV0U9R6_9TELE
MWKSRGKQMFGSETRLYVNSTDTHLQRVKVLLQWPGAGHYPPSPPKPRGYNNTVHSLHHFYVYPGSNLFMVFLLSAIHLTKLFLNLILLSLTIQTVSSFPWLSVISTRRPLLGLFPALFPTLSGGPQSSGNSSRMSDSHILPFRQPQGLKVSSALNQSGSLGTL